MQSLDGNGCLVLPHAMVPAPTRPAPRRVSQCVQVYRLHSPTDPPFSRIQPVHHKQGVMYVLSSAVQELHHYGNTPGSRGLSMLSIGLRLRFVEGSSQSSEIERGLHNKVGFRE